MSEISFFHIKKDLLGTRKIFPFQIYIYDPSDKSHKSFLKANSPLTKSQAAQLNDLLAKGFTIAISEKQKITFQRTLKLKKDDPILNSPIPVKKIANAKSSNVTNISTKTESQAIILPAKKIVKETVTKEELSGALLDQNYIILIEKAAKELANFSITDSQMTSLSVHLSNKFLHTDTKLNRVVAIGYFFAKTLNINDETRLASLVCAAYFSQIGMMSIALRLSRTDEKEYSEEDKSTYQKYPSLSLHLCRKAEIEVTVDFQNILLDHQEKLSGKGFPNGKTVLELSDTSLIVGFVFHIIEYNEKGLTLLEFINQNHNYLLLEFGDKIVNNFLEMLKTSTFKKAV
jgi:HD-GYP domain-containing protein (c-di-GMP phosphodiesterase class II)